MLHKPPLREPTRAERHTAYLRCRSIADLYARANLLVRFHCPRPHRAAAAFTLRGGGWIVVAFSGEDSWHVIIGSAGEVELFMAAEAARLRECERQEIRRMEARAVLDG